MAAGGFAVGADEGEDVRAVFFGARAAHAGDAGEGFGVEGKAFGDAVEGLLREDCVGGPFHLLGHAGAEVAESTDEGFRTFQGFRRGGGGIRRGDAVAGPSLSAGSIAC